MKKILLFFFALSIWQFGNAQVFSEDFESGIPGTMTQTYVTGTIDFTDCGGNVGGAACPYSGASSAHFYEAAYSGNQTSLETSNMDLSAGGYQLEFSHVQPDWSGDQNTLLVEISTDGGGTWTTMVDYISDIPAWVDETIFLDPFTTTATTIIRFTGTIDYGYAIGLDDIVVELAPTCPAPTALNATTMTSSGANLEWMDNASASIWDLEIGTTGFTPTGTPTDAGVGSNPYTWSSGSSNTSYDFYVRSDCGASGGTGVSSWAGPYTFTTLPDCPDPSALNATTITSSGANLEWMDNASASVWDLEIGATGFTPTGTPTDAGVGSNPYTWSSGSAATTYDFYVRADCASSGGTGTSAWVGPYTFTTACASFSVPWTEDFESMPSVGTGVVPNCFVEDGDWASSNATGSNNRHPNSGTHYMYTNWSANDWLFTPGIDLTGGTSYDFTFYYATDGNGGWTTLETGYGQGQTSGDMTIIGTAVSGATNTSYMQYTVSITPATTGTYNFGIHVVATSSPWYINFDDLEVKESPACPAPTALNATTMTSSGANLEWMDNASASVWDLEIGATGFTPTGTPTDAGVGSNPYTWSSGSSNTSYDFYVRSDCGASGGSGTSDWAGPYTFTTSPNSVSVPYSNDFESGLGDVALGVASQSEAILSTGSDCLGSNAVVLSGKTSTGFTGGSTSATATNAWVNNTTHHAHAQMTVDATGVTASLILEFNLKQEYSYGFAYSWFRVLVNGTQVSPDYNPSTQNSDPCDLQTIDLSAYAGTQFTLTFQSSNKYNDANGSGGQGDHAILDDISITEVSCVAPTALAAMGETNVGANLEWMDNASASVWDLEIGATGFTPTGTPTDAGVGSNPYTWSSGSASTTYDFYVRADCGASGGSGTSDWAGPYTFTTLPDCPEPTALNATTITSSGANLEWMDNASASVWDLEIGATGFTPTGTPTDAGVGSNPYTWSSGSAATTYDFYVRADCASSGGTGTSAWVGPYTFTTACASFSVPWTEDFESMPSVGAGVVPNCFAEVGDWASLNTTGSNNRHANSGTHYMYTNWSADDWLFTPGLDLTGGTSYDFTFYYATDGNSGWTTVETGYGQGQTSGDMTIIGTAVSGPTNTSYMQYTVSVTPATTGTYNFGIHVVATSSPWYISFDDLEVKESPACPAPTALNATTMTSSGANLEWMDNASASVWDLEIGATGFTPTGTPTDAGVGSNPYTWSSGSANTSYDFYVRSDCGASGGSGTSDWAGPYTFTTLCATFSNFPFTEDFEDASSSRGCWTQIQEAGSGSWTYATGSTSVITSANSGTQNARFVSQSGSNTPITKLVSPVFDVTSLTTPNLVFYYGQPDWSGDQNETKVYYSNDGGSSWNQIAHYTDDIGAWTRAEILLPNPTSTYMVAFEGINNYGRANVIDDVTIDEAPPCPNPAWTVVGATESAVVSDASCVDGTWTHFYNSGSNQLLLSLELDGTAVIPDNGVTIDPDGATDAFWVAAASGNFVDNGDGAAFMRRKWDVNASTQPSSPVGVRFYYTTDEYNAVNTEINANAGTPVPLTAHNQMRFFKILNGSDPFNVGSLALADGVELAHGAASTTSWAYNTFGPDHYAEMQVDGFSGGGGGGASGGAAFPIELIYLRGEAMEDGNKITFASATETNTEYHVIERSFDGKDNWVEIGRLDAAGNSVEEINYEFMDVNPHTVGFYRLNTIDFDGSTQISNAISVQRESNVFEFLSTFPNPTENDVTVNFNLVSERTVTVTLSDVSGKIIAVQTLEGVEGVNQTTIEMSNLHAGMFFIQIDNGAKKLMQRVVKN